MTGVSRRFHPRTLVPARFRAVVFDLDGVLLDTERLCSVVEAELCAEHGITHGPLDQAAVLGLSARAACAYYARRFGLPDSAVDELLARYESMLGDAIEREAEPLPGALELVTRLRECGVLLGVASNASRQIVSLAMRTAAIADCFDVVITADDSDHPKPAPDSYRLACLSLGVRRERALAIEDSLVGARAALASGLDCYVLPPAADVLELPVQVRLASLADLVTL